MMLKGFIQLKAGRLRAAVAPELGGAIAALRHHGDARTTPILREPAHDAAHAKDLASFPLIPFTNRVRDGRIRVENGEIRLTSTLPGERFPLHGSGWLEKWKVRQRDERSVHLAYHHEPLDWPWRYSARQSLRLDEAGLTIWLECRNESDSGMPCGLGQHPFFNCGPRTTLDAAVTHAWAVDQDQLPIARMEAADRYSLRRCSIYNRGFNNCFEGWCGTACIADPDWPFSLRLSSGEARFLQVYAPVGCPFFAAEPVSHAITALNGQQSGWAAAGLRLLESGEEAILTTRIEVIDPGGSS